MDELDSLLGLDPENEQDRLAGELVRADLAWVAQLVAFRKQLGLSQVQVAQAMGRSQSVVSDVETMSSDPRLSTLRRYALAIGAAVKHRVFPHAAGTPSIQAEHPDGVHARSAQAGSGYQMEIAKGLYLSSSTAVEVGAA